MPEMTGGVCVCVDVSVVDVSVVGEEDEETKGLNPAGSPAAKWI